MAIKAGQILHVMNKFVVDRIQTGGPGNLNIPQEKVYELGNYQSVATVRDVPDLTFNLDCLDVDTEIEALLVGTVNPYADADGEMYDLSDVQSIDILSPWKSPYGDFTAVRGVVVPNLTLESVSYRYGLQENAGEQFSLRGDSIFYVPGTPYQDIIAGSDLVTNAHDFAHGPALLYQEGGNDIYALSVTVNGERMTAGTDYTEDEDGITFTGTTPASGDVIRVCYGSATTGSYPQAGNSPDAVSGSGGLVHQSVSIKPAAIKGKDIDIYFSTVVTVGGTVTNKALTSNVATLTTATAHGLNVSDVVVVAGVDSTFNGTYTVTVVGSSTTFSYAKTAANVSSTAATGTASTATEVRWGDVQSFNCDWRVTIEDDYEFGNYRAIARDFADVPAVSGTVEVKPRSVTAFFDRLRQLTGVAADEVIGPQSSVAGSLRVVLRNPGSGGTSSVAAGTVLKTLYIPDARFTIPGYEGRVQQKMSVSLAFESDSGVLEIYKGDRA